MLIAASTRIVQMLACSMATVVAMGDQSFANDDWHFDSGEVASNTVCSMLHEDGGHILLVLHMRFPDKPDAGSITFSFRDETLIEAAKARDPVKLAFNTATLEGYRLGYTSSGFISITMTTTALADLFARFEKADHLDIVLPTTRVSFGLGGFEDALQELRSCAQPA